MKTELDKPALVAAIQDSLRNRLQALEVKLGTATALKHEAAFMSGAMCAINALKPNDDPNKISEWIPPMWCIAPMTGRSVLDKI